RDTAHYILERRGWSGRVDLNHRPHAPQACALPGCATSRQIRTVSFAVQQSQYVLQLLTALMEALPGCWLRVSLSLGRRLRFRPVLCRKLLASPGNSETLLVEQLADVEQELDISGPISPLPGLVLGGRELGEFAFPIPKDMGLYAYDFANFPDSVVELLGSKLHRDLNCLQVLRWFERDGLPAANHDSLASLRVDPFPVFAHHNAEAAKATNQDLLPSSEPALDDLKDRIHDPLRIGVGHSSVRIVDSLGEIVLVHVSSFKSESCLKKSLEMSSRFLY